MARGSALRSLTCISDRRKAHSLSLLARLHHCHHHQPSVYLNTSQESSVLHWATASVPARWAEIPPVLPSCSVPEVPADGDTGPQLWSVCDPALQRPPENVYAAAGWTDGGTASRFLLPILFHCWSCLCDRGRMNWAKVNVKSYSMPDLTSADFSDRSQASKDGHIKLKKGPSKHTCPLKPTKWRAPIGHMWVCLWT